MAPERAEDPRPVGAGIWLQALGQQVLDRLDLLAPLAAVSRPVSRVRIESSRGRELLDSVDPAAARDLPRRRRTHVAGARRRVDARTRATRAVVPVVDPADDAGLPSDLSPLAWPRDLFAPGVMRVPGMTRQMVNTLLGDRTSPWSAWELPA